MLDLESDPIICKKVIGARSCELTCHLPQLEEVNKSPLRKSSRFLKSPLAGSYRDTSEKQARTLCRRPGKLKCSAGGGSPAKISPKVQKKKNHCTPGTYPAPRSIKIVDRFSPHKKVPRVYLRTRHHKINSESVIDRSDEQLSTCLPSDSRRRWRTEERVSSSQLPRFLKEVRVPSPQVGRFHNRPKILFLLHRQLCHPPSNRAHCHCNCGARLSRPTKKGQS